MAADIHPLATHHLPVFITAPGETDVLFNVMTGVVILAVVLIGVLYFKIHALPEHIAHRTTKIQYEIVAVLGLLSLFTHEHIYWIIGLLLALVELPDFSTPLAGMANSLAKMARGTRARRDETPPSEKLEPVSLEPERAHQEPAKARDLTHA
jgi:hypothetical protein